MTEKKLDILVVFNSLMGGAIGGASRHIIEVADYWCISNKVHFLISKSGYRVAEEYIQKNPNYNNDIILYTTPFDDSKNRMLVYLSRIIKNVLMIPRLRKDYDVIVAPNYLPQNTIPAIFLKRKKTKLVVYFHTVQPSLRASYLRGMNLLQRIISIINWKVCVFLARFFDLIFVVNEAVRNYFIDEKGFAPEKVVVVNNGIPYKEIESIDIGKKEYDGVFLGRLVQRKGIYDMIEIWRDVVKKYPSAKLCMIGGGSEKEKLEMKIREEGLEESVILAGMVSDGEKFKLMKESRVFVSPSYYEAKPIVLLEAFACELPIVAYDLPVFEEVYQEFFNIGCVSTIEIGNYEGMTKKIIDIVENWEAYEKISKEAKKFVSKYDWKKIANYQLSCIEKLI